MGLPRAGWAAAELEPWLDADLVEGTTAGAGGVAADVVLQPFAGRARGVPRDIGEDRCRVEMDGLGKVDFEIFDLELAA